MAESSDEDLPLFEIVLIGNENREVPVEYSRRGADIEKKFRLLTGARPVRNKMQGDAELDGHFIEVKTAATGVIPHVRPVRYLTLVIYNRIEDAWYVVPPHEVIRLASQRKRGVTEVIYEETWVYMRWFSPFRVKDEAALGEAVRNAIAEGEKNPEVRELMDEIYDEIVALGKRAKARVLELLPIETQQTLFSEDAA